MRDGAGRWVGNNKLVELKKKKRARRKLVKTVVVCAGWWLSRVRLCDPMDCSLPGSSVQGIFQARIPEWVGISFSK